jgi:hypothetical protein
MLHLKDNGISSLQWDHLKEMMALHLKNNGIQLHAMGSPKRNDGASSKK